MIARRRVRGGVCDVRTRPQTRAMKLPALRYLICSPAVGDRGIGGAAAAIGRRGASRRCPRNATVKSQQPGCPRDQYGQAQGAPGAKQTAADEFVRCAAPT